MRLRMASSSDVSICCGSCNFRCHPPLACVGLPDSVIDAIKEYGGRVTNLSCTSFRLEEGSGSYGPQFGSVVYGDV